MSAIKREYTISITLMGIPDKTYWLMVYRIKKNINLVCEALEHIACGWMSMDKDGTVFLKDQEILEKAKENKKT